MSRTALGTTFTAELAAAAVATRWENVSPPAREIAAQCVLDWFGVALRGHTEPVAELLWRDAQQDGGGAVCSVIGRAGRLPMLQAALVNGATSHALDYDDVHLVVGHPSTVILPALLALGEHRHADGRALITAFCAGYEAACLVGEAIGEQHYQRGFHTTATVGIFGAAVACAHLLGLDEDGMRRTIGIAATQAAGLKAMFGSMCKPFHAGRAARDGLHAARLAAAGMSADGDILDGRIGYLSLLGRGTEDLPAVQGRTTVGLRSNLFKYHAACYLTHAAIEATRAIAAELKARPQDIESVRIRVHHSLDSVCNIPSPTTGLELKFSLRYVVAMALTGLDTTHPDTYSDAQAAVLAALPFVSAIRVDLEPEHPITFSDVEVRLKDGRVGRRTADSSQPAEDLSAQRDSLVAKFHALTADGLDADRRQRLVAAVLDLAHCRDVGALFQLASPAATEPSSTLQRHPN